MRGWSHVTPPKLAALKLFDCLAAWLLVIFWILNALWIRRGGKRHGVHLQVQSQWRTLGSVRSFDKRCLHGPWVFPENMMVILPGTYNLMSFSFLYRNISCWSLPEIHVLWDFLHCSFFEASAENAPFHCHLIGMPRWWAIPVFLQQPSPLCALWAKHGWLGGTSLEFLLNFFHVPVRYRYTIVPC